jgi:hypothetical protein
MRNKQEKIDAKKLAAAAPKAAATMTVATMKVPQSSGKMISQND